MLFDFLTNTLFTVFMYVFWLQGYNVREIKILLVNAFPFTDFNQNIKLLILLDNPSSYGNRLTR